MELPNPNDGKKFDRVQGDYGYRQTPDGQEETVHIPTNKSNTQYWKPELVLDTANCQHEYHVIDMGKREVECTLCHHGFTFHATDVVEENGALTIYGKQIQNSSL